MPADRDDSERRQPAAKTVSLDSAKSAPKTAEGAHVPTRRSAKHVAHYADRHEDFVLVSRSNLKEISQLSLLQEGAGAVGMFFFSGAFWLLATILFEHNAELAKYAPWLLLCVISILFGVVLIWIGWEHYKLRKDAVDAAFLSDATKEPDGG